MAKARNKNRRERKRQLDDRIMPTPEQLAKGEFRSAGRATIRTPVIDTMLKRGQLTEREHNALSYYRAEAIKAERSPLRSCLDNSPGGSGHGPSAATISAMLETSRIERDMGSLYPIARAIAVDDKSITEWCIEQHGGRERYNGKGEFIAIVPVSEKTNVEAAMLELRFATRRISCY